MLNWLAALTVVLTAADHWTTYLCLRSPVEGWRVSELNPLAEWLFASFGLVNGLLIDSAITIVAVGFLLSTGMFPRTAKGVCFSVLCFSTGLAVLNNLRAIEALGLSPFGVL
jgi:hypothetical protein